MMSNSHSLDEIAKIDDSSVEFCGSKSNVVPINTVSSASNLENKIDCVSQQINSLKISNDSMRNHSDQRAMDSLRSDFDKKFDQFSGQINSLSAQLNSLQHIYAQVRAH